MSETVRDAAGALGWEILERIRAHPDPTTVPTSDPLTGESVCMWDPLALDNGDLGVALVLSAADELAPDDGWDRAAWGFVKRAVDALGARAGQGVAVAGLFSGAAAVAHTLRALSRGGERYRNAIAGVDAILFDLVGERLAAVPDTGPATDDYDIIVGLAGPARLLLQRPDRDGRAQEAARALVTRLVRWALADDGYRTPPSRITPVERDRHPDLLGGYVNLGYAHGIAGVLAVLGAARRRGVPIDGLDDAVARLASVLTGATHAGDHGPELPFHLPTAPVTGDGPGSWGRIGWCYGNVGAALAFAECARTDPALAGTANELFSAATTRPPTPLDDNPSLCHGVGGLMAIRRHLAATGALAPDPAAAERLAARLLGMRDPASAFALRNLQDAGLRTDSPGFLTGSGGAAVALVSWHSGDRLTTAEQLICGGDLC